MQRTISGHSHVTAAFSVAEVDRVAAQVRDAYHGHAQASTHLTTVRNISLRSVQVEKKITESIK